MEWEIIKPFWDKGPMAARDVFQVIPKDRNWAYRTVKTVLGRLVKKGALTYDQIGNSYLYRPVFTREEMTQASVGSFLHRVFDGALKPFVAYFAEGISVLIHEIAHVRRKDMLSGWITAIISVLYWFHPAVWFANINLRREREMACDDSVLDTTQQDGKTYASIILKVARSFDGAVPRAAGFLGLLELFDNLLGRIRSAGDPDRSRRLNRARAFAMLTVAVWLLPMGVWRGRGDMSAEAAGANSPPKIVSTVPVMNAKDVDPGTKELRVTFDQDMGTGYSWTGGGPDYPKTTGQPRWIDKRTCALPVALEPGKFYRVGINSTSYTGFSSASGVPATVSVISFTTKGAGQAEQGALEKPSILSMVPANNATKVSPSLTELTVTFSVPMGKGFSWTGGGENFPEGTGSPKWSADGKTCTMPVKLKPNWSYRLGLNSQSHKNFQSARGVPLDPVLWQFSTGAN